MLCPNEKKNWKSYDVYYDLAEKNNERIERANTRTNSGVYDSLTPREETQSSEEKKQHNKTTHNTYREKRDCVTRLLHTQLTAVAEKLNRFSCVVQQRRPRRRQRQRLFCSSMWVSVWVLGWPEYSSIYLSAARKRYTIRPIYSHSVCRAMRCVKT